MALQRLNKIKEKHSKVRNISHETLKMQNYLKSNRQKITSEESQIVFKMRSRVTNVKINLKGNFENLLCSVCNNENESQQHIIECKEISKHKKNVTKRLDYEKLFGENVRKQMEIANDFIESMKIKSKLEQKV